MRESAGSLLSIITSVSSFILGMPSISSARFPTTYIIESIATYMTEGFIVVVMVTSITVLVYVITKRREAPTTIPRNEAQLNV